MKKKTLWIIIGLAVVIIFLIVLKSSGALGKEEGIKVSAEKVTKRTIIETVTASGKIYPEIEVKVSPDISGEIVELNVQEGDSVRKGQVLAKIYADIYSTQRDQAAAIVNQQEAMTANQTAQLESLKSTLDQAQSTYNRQKKLMDDKVISKAEFEQAETTLHTAQANYNAAIQSIRSNKASESSARANLNKANKDLGRTTIVSPMNGVISLLSVKKGERVAGNSFNVGTEMMRIADLKSIEVQVDVSENDIPKVKLGDSADVEVDAYNQRKFKGVVYKIANPTPSLTSSSGSTTTVTNYEVHIRLLPESYKDLMGKGKPFPFRPNMTGSADIKTHTEENVLSVPLNAVTTRDKNNNSTQKTDDNNNNNNSNNNDNATVNSDDINEVVFVVQKDGTVKQHIVKTGIQDLNNIQVLSGINTG